jgi:hypothetical protein
MNFCACTAASRGETGPRSKKSGLTRLCKPGVFVNSAPVNALSPSTPVSEAALALAFEKGDGQKVTRRQVVSLRAQKPDGGSHLVGSQGPRT